MRRALRFVGLSLGWLLAAALWMLVAFALSCLGWFLFVGPEEERGIAGIWVILTIVVGTPALFLTAYLGGFLNRLLSP